MDTDFLNEIDSLHPKRRSKKQKAHFREYVIEEMKKNGKAAECETLDGKHQNIVIGDAMRAKVIFSAHYDTPAASLIPNLMMPRNPVICYFYNFAYPLVLALLSVFAAGLIQALLTLNDGAYIALFLVFYFGSYLLLTRTFTNRHNKNDNTSGVAAVLSLALRCCGEDIAFILFDNEEKGLKGSRAYKKHRRDIAENAFLINLDCVGYGKNILAVAKDAAEKHQAFPILKKHLHSTEDFDVLYFPKRGSVGSTDYKNFKCGIGLMACKRSRLVGYYTARIHTPWDTVATNENIEFLSSSLSAFANAISEEKALEKADFGNKQSSL